MMMHWQTRAHRIEREKNIGSNGDTLNHVPPFWMEILDMCYRDPSQGLRGPKDNLD